MLTNCEELLSMKMFECKTVKEIKCSSNFCKKVSVVWMFFVMIMLPVNIS